MNAKVYFFRLTIAAVTLTLGVGIYFIWQSFSTKPVSAISTVAKPTVEIVKPETVAEFAEEQNELPKEEETVQTEFEAEGDYYLIGDLPKGFKDFDSISIITNNYEVKEDGSAYGNPIPPKGQLYTKTEHKFARININNRRISFETESKNEVSYQFIGFFPEEEYEDKKLKDWVSLEGTLTKFKNGKKVAEIKAKFGYIHGC